MPTLHIEHAITDFDLWKGAFDRFADFRKQSGVLAQRIQRPADDPNYVLIDLEFATFGEAQGFLEFLHAKVWASSANAPALVGSPQTKILETVTEQ